ncbi:hypothetical protein CPB97_005726, partial [Podila verticillata]
MDRTYPPAQFHTINPRFVNGTAPTLFKNGYNFDDENEGSKGDLLIDQIIIVQVGGEIKAPSSQPLWISRDISLRLATCDEGHTLSTNDMLVKAGVEDKSRYMKMACGENPNRVYGQYFHTMPSTRLGEGWLLCDQSAKATKLKDAQDNWCQPVKSLPKYGRCRLDTPFSEDLQYESLVAVLRDDVKLNIHCYETHDLEAMVRHSNEY